MHGPDLQMHRLHESGGICSEPTGVSPCRKGTFAFTHGQKAK